VWCFGIKYEDPKYFYIMGMAGAGALSLRPSEVESLKPARNATLTGCRRPVF